MVAHEYTSMAGAKEDVRIEMECRARAWAKGDDDDYMIAEDFYDAIDKVKKWRAERDPHIQVNGEWFGVEWYP